MKTAFYKIFTVLLLLGQSSTVLGQNPSGNLFAGNGATANNILLKWVTPELGAPDGFNVYRQNEGENDWVLINPVPVKKMAVLELNPTDRDDAITYLEDFIEKNELSTADPFTLLLLSRKLVELNDFAKYLGLFYQDETVQPGQSYRYKVNKIAGNNEQLVGLSPTITAKPFEPIEPPLGIKVYVDERVDTLVKVFWTPEETRYFAVNVYRALQGGESRKLNENPAIPTKNTNAAGELIYPALFYENGGHEIGNTYNYELKGIDFFGRESKISPPFEIEIFDRSAAPPPTGLETVRIGPRDVMVIWAATDAANLAGYDVFVGDSLKAVFVKANVGMLPADQTEYIYQIEDENWGDRFFYVEAVNALGVRSASTKMGLTMWDIIPPAVPTGLVAIPHPGAIEIKWNRIVEPDLAGYVVYRSVANAPDEPFAMISSGAIDTTTLLDSLPKEARNKYYYKVAAVDTSGNLSERSEIVFATMPDVVAPISPTIKRIQLNKDTAILTWLPSIDEELKGYYLYRCLAADTTQWTLLNREVLAPNTTEYTDVGLAMNTEYGYQIFAEDGAANRSAASNRYTVKTRPDHGEDLVANKLNASYSKRKKAVVLTWKSGPSVSGYVIYRQEGSSRFLPLTELLTDTVAYEDKDLRPDRTYSYHLRTYYTDGNITRSAPTAVVTE